MLSGLRKGEFLSAHDDTSDVNDHRARSRQIGKMCMAQVIEFATLARVTPRVRWSRDEQLGKVIPFMAQRDASEEPDCVACEELDSESSRRHLSSAQPLRLEEQSLCRTPRAQRRKDPRPRPFWALLCR